MENSRKRILIATGIFPPQVGGPATYSKLLSEELPKKGFTVRVENFGSVLKYPKIIRHFIYIFRLIFAGSKSDIIFAQDPVSVGLPSLIVSKLLRKKFYLKIVGDYAWEQGNQRAGVKDFLDEFSLKQKGYPTLVQILKKIQLMVANGANKIIVPSNYLKKIVSNWGVNSNKITVIYNAFNPPILSKDQKEIRNELDIKNNSIISAGRLVPWKGFDTLINLIPLLKNKIPDVHLYIAGDGPEKKLLEKLIRDKNLNEEVTLLGKLEQNKLFEYIKGADVFVLNTSYEGLSHQLLEVMALGTPIITTNVGGNPEVVSNIDNGILVSYNNSEELFENILNILNNKELGLKFVFNSFNRIQRFNEEKMLEEISAFLMA